MQSIKKYYYTDFKKCCHASELLTTPVSWDFLMLIMIVIEIYSTEIVSLL